MAAFGHSFPVIHLPVFEFLLAFSVYRVHNIPRTAANGSIAVLQSGIPDFLAVSTDHQTFMEVAGRDLDQCILPAKTVCPINRVVSKTARKNPVRRRFFWKTREWWRMFVYPAPGRGQARRRFTWATVAGFFLHQRIPLLCYHAPTGRVRQ
jgi:hypothetical protein